MMPNANRRRGAYSGWTRRRGATGAPPEPRPRLDLNLRRAPAEPVAFPRDGVGQADADQLSKVVVFCLDETGRVLTSGEVAYTSREELARRLAEDVRRYPVVEAWQGCVCLLRLGGPAWPDGMDDEI
jgi:hypothetical protein